MSTYYSLRYHWICSTKERRPFISPDWRPRFHEYLGGTVRGLMGIALEVGGIDDHVHLLAGLKTTHCVAGFSRELKKAGSAWARENGDAEFTWQKGYSVFTVSQSRVQETRWYIQGQEEHHRKRSFEDELRAILRKHGIEYDPKYLV